MARTPPSDRQFSIWHVRRNPEMRLGIWARDVRRLPVRLVFTSAAIRRHSAFPRWLISKMDAVIATTDEAAGFVPNVKAVVPHGVDTALFHPSEDRAKAWADLGYPGRMGIATIGRVRPEKGTDRFIDTMLEVLPKHPDVTALVIGAALGKHQAFETALKKKVAAVGLSDRLIFTGEIAAPDLPKIMRALSLLVALPRYEGYGMTPLEAMASAVPFVATDTGYFEAFSAHGSAGLVLDHPDQAASIIGDLLDAPDRLARMSGRARDVACQSYAIKSEADGIAEVYEALWTEAA